MGVCHKELWNCEDIRNLHTFCGTYLHQFEWHSDPEAPCSYLNFEGVDSCFYVWLNGTYVGYSQVSHHTSEFDVTGLLREGENLLAVLVLKWKLRAGKAGV